MVASASLGSVGSCGERQVPPRKIARRAKPSKLQAALTAPRQRVRSPAHTELLGRVYRADCHLEAAQQRLISGLALLLPVRKDFLHAEPTAYAEPRKNGKVSALRRPQGRANDSESEASALRKCTGEQGVLSHVGCFLQRQNGAKESNDDCSACKNLQAQLHCPGHRNRQPPARLAGHLHCPDCTAQAATTLVRSAGRLSARTLMRLPRKEVQALTSRSARCSGSLS